MSRDRSIVVTTAGRTPAQDRRLRTQRYLFTQALRLACILLAVLLPVGPAWKIALIVGSVVLPWLGVVAANAGPSVERRHQSAVVTAVRPHGAAPVAVEPGRIIDAGG
jgi:hypothetical protein